MEQARLQAVTREEDTTQKKHVGDFQGVPLSTTAGTNESAAPTETLKPLEGRVFERMQRYQALPEPVKVQADTIGVHLVESKDKVFTSNKWIHRASAPCVKGKNLLDYLENHLMKTEARPPSTACVKEIAEALVLAGFIAPVKESENRKINYINEKDYYELVTPAATTPGMMTEMTSSDAALGCASSDKKLSVWHVVDGATCAGHFQRGKASMFVSPKEVYGVVNELKRHSLTLFHSDVARECLCEIPLTNAHVSYDTSLEHGLRVTCTSPQRTESCGFHTVHQQELWLHAMLEAGAKYEEQYHTEIETMRTFYDLIDVDEMVSMKKFQGQVCLLVNVASEDRLANEQYEELVNLYEKYERHGLQVLVFPCNQFACKEPVENDKERVQYLAQKYRIHFPVFERHDVNGPNARQVFTFLKGKLHGQYGAYVDWNFTKFLVDRQGNPVSRFEANVRPSEMEDEVKKLLERSTKETETENQEKVKTQATQCSQDDFEMEPENEPIRG